MLQFSQDFCHASGMPSFGSVLPKAVVLQLPCPAGQQPLMIEAAISELHAAALIRVSHRLTARGDRPVHSDESRRARLAIRAGTLYPSRHSRRPMAPSHTARSSPRPFGLPAASRRPPAAAWYSASEPPSPENLVMIHSFCYRHNSNNSVELRVLTQQARLPVG